MVVLETMEVKYHHRDVEHFLGSLENVTRSAVTRTIQLLVEKTYRLTMPDSKRIEKNLYELRINSLQNVRIFYTFYEQQIVLLYAIYKKSQKLSQKDLSTARQRLRQLHS